VRGRPVLYAADYLLFSASRVSLRYWSLHLFTMLQTPTKHLNLVVGIATVGRPEILSETVRLLARQSRLPDRLVICPVKPSDIDLACSDSFPAPVEIVCGPVGLPAQRNRILAACSAADVVVFFDDDFFADADYLAEVEKTFLADPALAALTGGVLADGIGGPGISPTQGLEILRSSGADRRSERVFPIAGMYGCNMAFRMEIVRSNAIQFDENLPLYGWQEDIDFSKRVARHGRIMKSERLRGVHLGAKGGRTSGLLFGYSQIVNPVYLVRKGTFSAAEACKMILKNILANHLKMFAPEPWIDRRGRCKGNWLGIFDLLRGRDHPRNILAL
jgi:hypothetical protein